MIRLCLILALCICGLAAWAQTTPEPQLKVELEESEAILGQTLTLRITVLVPTWMPDPPVWPDFETPNVQIALPERSSSPVSQTIDGETWSGISRRYLITPMAPGTVTLPATSLTLTYAQPPATEPLTTTLTLDPITLTGVVPKGAEGLDPFIAAEKLTLTQSVDGDTTGLKGGDSFTRTITATVNGVSPVFLPPLVPDDTPDGLRAYPESPVLDEKSDRGELSGTRTEKITYVVEGSVQGTLPALTLDWFNMSGNAVEAATLDGVDVQATAPAAPAAAAKDIDWKPLLIRAVPILIALVVLVLAAQRLMPRLTLALRRKQQRHRASAAFAWTALKSALGAQDLSATRAALSEWQRRAGQLPASEMAEIEAAFAAIGRVRFGPNPSSNPSSNPGANEDAYWQSLSRLIDCAKHAGSTRAHTDSALPALNPLARPHP
ncbi:BatD family protein [Shimia sp.]|uniref:BatD family protein n=1 Tax=Shimia sp. TaxID=1954381 RepID=UPI0032979C1D